MDVFKLEVSNTQVYKITVENFDSLTQRKAPWYQKIGDKESAFAVCPACNNPTQLIGIVKKINIQPFGKHFVPQTGLVVEGYVDKEAMEYCPYYLDRRKVVKSTRRRVENPTGKLIKDTLIENFDRVVSVVEQATGLKISMALAQSLLEDYKATEGWLYVGATLRNIPWTFIYMSESKKVFGRILKDERMIAELQDKVPSIVISDGKVGMKEGHYCDLGMCFITHRQTLLGQGLEESFDFVISNKERKEVCRKTMKIGGGFSAMIFKNDTIHRRMEFVKLAKTVLLEGFEQE